MGSTHIAVYDIQLIDQITQKNFMYKDWLLSAILTISHSMETHENHKFPRTLRKVKCTETHGHTSDAESNDSNDKDKNLNTILLEIEIHEDFVLESANVIRFNL